MAQYKITIEKEDLHQLFNQDQGIAKLIGKVLNKVLEAEVAEQLQAGPYEHCESRQGYRNGYRERGLKTRIGTLELAVPRIRDCNNFRQPRRVGQSYPKALPGSFLAKVPDPF